MSKIGTNGFERRLEVLRQRYPDYKPYFDLYTKVILQRKKYKEQPQINPISFSEEMAQFKLKGGFSVLGKEALEIDLSHAQGLFFFLCESLKEIPELKEKTEKIAFYFQKRPSELEMLLKDFLKEKSLPMTGDLDVGIRDFLVFHSIKPSIEANLEQIAPKIKDFSWSKGYCPVCGEHPFIAALRENGKRFAKCSLCGYEWQIERIFCPFCGNRDHQRIKYFEAEGEKEYRVYLCENCKAYLKTIDEREIEGEVDLELEDIVTVHLDVLAERQGYKKMGV